MRISDDNNSCFRIEPNLDLPAKEWSLVELVNKLGLQIITYGNYIEKNNKEFFTRIGGEFNRLYELREHLKCRTCEKYMRSLKYNRWNKVKNLWSKILFDHFAAFSSTVFQCNNPNCHDRQEVYLSFCWHCKEIIDSRDCHTKVKGYYICESCGAGYKDAVGLNNSLYAIFPATLCPSCLKCDNCGATDFDIIELEEPTALEELTAKLQCNNGGKEMLAPVTMKPDSSKKFKCSKCGREMQMEIKTLERQEQRNSLKRINWQQQKNFNL